MTKRVPFFGTKCTAAENQHKKPIPPFAIIQPAHTLTR